jgi:hypothetical protein
MFNLISGLILDTFSLLRQESHQRKGTFNRETFVSGLQRTFCEEHDIDFTFINNHDQDQWNYLFYIIYLKTKDSNEYTGVESYVFSCLENDNPMWLPTRECCAHTENVMSRNNKSESLQDQVSNMAAELSAMKALLVESIENGGGGGRGRERASEEKR